MAQKKPKEPIVKVRFSKYTPPYTGGDIAGFPASKSAEIVSRGLAVYVDPPKRKRGRPKKETAPPPDAPPLSDGGSAG